MKLGCIKKKRWEGTGSDEELKREGEVYMWEEQEMSLGKTRDEIGRNRRKVWAKQKEGLKSSVLNKDFCPLTFLSVDDRWLRVPYRIIILWLTSVQGAGWRPSKRFAQGNALGRTNAPMRPEGAKALGDRPSEGTKLLPLQKAPWMFAIDLWLIANLELYSLYK